MPGVVGVQRDGYTKEVLAERRKRLVQGDQRAGQLGHRSGGDLGPVPQLSGTLIPLDKPLPPLGQYLLGMAIALDTNYTGHVPDIDPRTATARQADDYMNDRTARIYPGLVQRP